MDINNILRSKYKLIIFDWDGTAVMSRNDNASEFIDTAQQLINKGIRLAVITGTKFENIDNQLTKHINTNKNLIHICTNRGSEVFSFDENGNKKCLYDRKISNKENELLDKIVVTTANKLKEISYADVDVIFNRKNRRKIDLLPEWKSPKKNEFNELLVRVEEKLDSSGLAGGLRKAYSLLEQTAKSYGFTQAKITSDIKHLEIGITDKNDSINWLYTNVIKANLISDNYILIAGDEFGDIGGFSGSDYKMVLPDKKDITYISVGIEPNGVPEPIIYLGGGPERFNEILRGL